MRNLLLFLFITGVISIKAQTAASYSKLSPSNTRKNWHQSDRLCRKVPQKDSCLLPHNLLESINLYPGFVRQATNILLPSWKSSAYHRKQLNIYPPAQYVSINKSSQTGQSKYQTLVNSANPLPAKFPSIERSSLILSTPNQLNQKNKSLLAHPAPETITITSPYGWRRRPYSGRRQFHKGIDYGAPLGSPVVAANDGVVIKVVSGCIDFGNIGCGSQFGNWIEIDHGNGLIATYAHLRHSSIAVRKGMKVTRNQQIAKVGSSGWSTGAHLDFRIKVNGQFQNPQDFVLVKK